MADAGVELRSIAWSQALPFVRLFRSVSLALDFKRIILALAAILLVYIAGSVLDLIWTGAGAGVAVSVLDEREQTEVGAYATLSRADFAGWTRAAREDRSELAVDAVLESGAITDPAEARHLVATQGPTRIVMTDAYREKLKSASKLVESQLSAARAALGSDKKLSSDECAAQRASLAAAGDVLRMVLASSGARYLPADEAVGGALTRIQTSEPAMNPNDAKLLAEAVRTQAAVHKWESRAERGIFRSLMDTSAQCFAGAVQGVVGGHWGVGNGPFDPQPSLGRSVGAFAGTLLWLVTQRPWYTLCFGAVALLIFAYFGGAICRSVAVQAARDESISLSEATRFAREKYFGFVTAPLMPLGIAFGLVVLMWAGGLIGAIPRIGELAAGVLFPLTVLGGLALAMIFLALVLGFHLMWPTIAVEGSDGFDALSRACSYVGSRLWHVAFYAFSLLVYGAFAFIVVRYIATLALKFTHWGAGRTFNFGSNVALDTVGKLDGIWRMPAWSDLTVLPTATGMPFWGRFYNAPLNATEWIAYVLITATVFLVVGVVAAFVVSFFFCGSTQMYFLLRREVDATDFDEVYYEEPEGEFVAGGAVPASNPASPASGEEAPTPPASM